MTHTVVIPIYGTTVNEGAAPPAEPPTADDSLTILPMLGTSVAEGSLPDPQPLNTGD